MPSLSALQSILNSVGFHHDVNTWLTLFTLVFARVAAAVVLAPFLGGASVPGQIKTGIALLLTLTMMPALVSNGTALPPSGMVYLALLAKEVVVGSMIGFLSQLVFYAVQMAGTLIDTQRGLNQITFLAPQLDGHPSALGSLQFQAALVIFFVLQGHLMFIATLMKSFGQLPLLEIPHMAGGLTAVTEQAARMTANTLLLGCQIAAPVVLALFLVDVAFASAGRVASQIRINSEAFTAKALVGLGLVCLLTATFLDQLEPAFARMLRSISGFTDVMK
jgi:flagellar biosynthetic protein FliR